MLYALYYPQGKDQVNGNEASATGIPGLDASFLSAQPYMENIETFQYTIERMRHYLGAWHSVTAILFPQFLFLECEQELAGELMEKQVPLIAMPEDVSQFLADLFGAQHHICMSRGVIRDGVAHVTEGPLMGYDNRIVRIDRHKRLAWLKMSENAHLDFSKESTSVLVAGLEITERS
ncbi:MAG: hypothetical protein LIP10_06470 [Clostridiales bacterium]|nr:hypothetical protein [Clostridiales bacterium]